MRSVLFIASLGLAASFGCGDDDDDNPSPGPGADAGTAGTSGKGSGGAGGKGGSGGKATAPVTEEDAGVSEEDAGEPEPTSAYRNLTIELTGMTDEVGEFVQFRLIDENSALLFLGAIHGLPSADFTFELPNSVPPGHEVTLEVWGDTSGSVANSYDAGADHAWIETIAAGPVGEAATVTLAHGTQSPPPTVNHGTATGSLSFEMMGTNDYAGDRFELRVNDTETGRLVARHLMPEIPGGTVALEVYGVIHSREYNVDFTIDLNGNDRYDAPPADAAWRQTITSSPTGFEGGPGATITLASPPSDSTYVDVGF